MWKIAFCFFIYIRRQFRSFQPDISGRSVGPRLFELSSELYYNYFLLASYSLLWRSAMIILDIINFQKEERKLFKNIVT